MTSSLAPSIVPPSAAAIPAVPPQTVLPPSGADPVAGPGAGDRSVRLQIGAIDLRLAAPSSADDLLDAATDADDLPFWAHVWDSGFGLGRCLVQIAAARHGERLRVLEIGCGIGAVGCLAAALGWDVTMTDYQPAALRYAAANVRENHLHATLVLADWRSFPIVGTFDLVVGSDVLYESTLHPALAALLGGFRDAGATVLLADPGRPNALNFATAREKDGWPVSLEFWEGQDSPIAVYRFEPPKTLAPDPKG
ncbi:MAG: class I SAM-dependent methyltransferase [Chloroflexi bacterium]|nr:class I SAM-dependent methyltransferase [Chloroflexota bacterium]